MNIYEHLEKDMAKVMDIILRSNRCYLLRKDQLKINFFVMGEDIPAGTLRIPNLLFPTILDGLLNKTTYSFPSDSTSSICFWQRNEKTKIRTIPWTRKHLLLEAEEDPDWFPLSFLLHPMTPRHYTAFDKYVQSGVMTRVPLK